MSVWLTSLFPCVLRNGNPESEDGRGESNPLNIQTNLFYIELQWPSGDMRTAGNSASPRNMQG